MSSKLALNSGFPQLIYKRGLKTIVIKSKTQRPQDSLSLNGLLVSRPYSTKVNTSKKESIKENETLKVLKQSESSFLSDTLTKKPKNKTFKTKKNTKTAASINFKTPALEKTSKKSRLRPCNKSAEFKTNLKPKFSALNASNFTFKAAKKSYEPSEVATLNFGLDRVLFNPGVTYLQDPNSGVFNFNPYLKDIIEVDEFDYSKIIGYVPASKDKALQKIARDLKRRYITTTSSTTQLLCHLYYVISNWRPIDTSSLSKEFRGLSKFYSSTLTFPPSIRLKRHEGGVYSINADKTFDRDSTVLSQLGQVMERMLTLSPEEFDKYLVKPSQNNKEDGTTILENSVYNYTLTDHMVLRAQLDCFDPRLPNKIFDLKTRAVYPIRLDQPNYKQYLGYEITGSQGLLNSFSREYYDLMRSAFLKYSFQVRIGRMDGCLVAYHNTNQIFGFQYVSLKEMDKVLFGNSVLGEQAFANSLQLLEKILNLITEKYSDEDLMITLRSSQDSLVLDIFVEFFPPGHSTSTKDNTSSSSLVVDPLHKLAKFQLVCYSTVNGEQIDTPIRLDAEPGLDRWDVHYNIKEVDMDPLDLYNDYLSLRYQQAEYFNFDRESSPVLQKLRALSSLNTKNPQVSKKAPIVFKSMS